MDVQHDLAEYDSKYKQVLCDRVSELNLAGKSVLCLGARIGTEVKAFRDQGAFALGIDINPGTKNEYVIFGDFHHLKFPDRCVDVVFTNCLDHAFDLHRVLDEIRRVLRPSGQFLIEAVAGLNAGKQPGFYESFWWLSIDDLVQLIQKSGFALRTRAKIEYPWEGEALHWTLEERIPSVV
jgi:SAM-dependent methyltransferase